MTLLTYGHVTRWIGTLVVVGGGPCLCWVNWDGGRCWWPPWLHGWNSCESWSNTFTLLQSMQCFDCLACWATGDVVLLGLLCSPTRVLRARSNIGRRTFLAVELVNNTRFVHSFDLILGGHKLLPDGVNWLVMGADALTLIDSGNSLIDTLDVGDYHTSFRGGLLAYFAFCLSVSLLLLTAKTHGS